MTPELELLEPFRASPASAALVLDYDGTLSSIVEDPARAVPLPPVPELLDRLAARLGLVAVISGRPVEFLSPLLPPSVALAGLYGLELLADGQRRDHPQAGVWREVVDDVAGRAEVRGPAGMVVERKDLSITLHFRAHPEVEDEVGAYAHDEALRSGLVARPARMSWELHPPIDVDKGSAILDLADDFATIGYAGDDLGDLPAFDALDVLSARGTTTVRLAIRSDEAPEELLDRADIVLEDPEALVDLLAGLT